jgi:membrane protease YdiL (CAAX protease family)
MERIHVVARWLKNHSIKGILVDLVLVAAVYLLGQATVSAVIWSGGVTSLEELYTRPKLLITAYVIGGLVSLAGVIGVLRLRKTSLKDIALKRPKLTDIGYGVLGFGAYFLLVRIVLILVGIVFPSFNVSQEQNIGLSNLTQGLLPAAFIGLAVLPPLTEELLFRGFLLTRLQRYKVKLIYDALSNLT